MYREVVIVYLTQVCVWFHDSAAGGDELWMIGKNFLKDCVVVFQESSLSKRLPNKVWVKSVEPLKDYFNSTHLIVVIPPYVDSKVREAVTVNVTVKCGGKAMSCKILRDLIGMVGFGM